MNVYQVRVTIKSKVPILADDWVNEALGDRLLDSEVEEIEVELISEKHFVPSGAHSGSVLRERRKSRKEVNVRLTVNYRDRSGNPTTADEAQRLEITRVDLTVINRSAEQGRALLAHAEASSAPWGTP